MLRYASGSRSRVLRMSPYYTEVMSWTLSGLRAVYIAIHVPYCIVNVPYCKYSKIVIFRIFETVNGYKTVTKTVLNVRYISLHVQTYIVDACNFLHCRSGSQTVERIQGSWYLLYHLSQLFNIKLNTHSTCGPLPFSWPASEESCVRLLCEISTQLSK